MIGKMDQTIRGAVLYRSHPDPCRRGDNHDHHFRRSHHGAIAERLLGLKRAINYKFEAIQIVGWFHTVRKAFDSLIISPCIEVLTCAELLE